MLQELLDLLTLDEMIAILYSIAVRLAWRGLLTGRDVGRIHALDPGHKQKAA